jgi:hypothetical protein
VTDTPVPPAHEPSAPADQVALPAPPPPPKARARLLTADSKILSKAEQNRLQALRRPLSPVALFRLRLALRFTRDVTKYSYLRQRLLLHQKAVKRKKAQQASQKVLFKEADIFHAIIVGTWSRLGYSHSFSKRGKHKVHKVAIERIDCQEERIYYKILTTRRTPLKWKNALPYKVTVSDLLAKETLFELSMACQRRVSAYHEDRKGAWIIVDRLDGVGGLPKLVRYRSVLDQFPDWSKEPEKRRPLVCLGMREHRWTEIVDLEDHPHILVGGESGGGKSNLVNLFICTLISRLAPVSLQLMLVDFKRVEFVNYAEVPHLACDVITEIEDVIEALGSLVALIDERMKVMEGRARKLSDWNKRYPKRALPRVLLIIDEFAQIMLGQPKEVSGLVVDLLSQVTNLGRAAGVHAMVCTQRPAVEVVPANVKYNMPLRIAGAVSTPADSVTILGVGDAAYLDDVPGRMVVKTGRHRITLQTPFVADDDIQLAVRDAREMPRCDPLVLPEPKIPLIYNRPALLREVVSPDGQLAGSLAVSRLVDAFGAEGMTRAQAQSFVAWCRNLYEQHDAISVGSDLYAVVRERSHYRLDRLLPGEIEGGELGLYLADDLDSDEEGYVPDEEDDMMDEYADARALWRDIQARRAQGEYVEQG